MLNVGTVMVPWQRVAFPMAKSALDRPVETLAGYFDKLHNITAFQITRAVNVMITFGMYRVTVAAH